MRRNGWLIGVALPLIILGASAAAQRPPRAGGLSGRWLGQDGHDVVGPSSKPAPSDVQDLHFSLRGIPPGRAIVGASVKGLGGAEWVYVANGTAGPWRAEVAHKKGEPTAEVFVEPYQVETGRPFDISVKLDDNRTMSVTILGGKADPNRRMAGAAALAKWVGQKGDDRCGSGPAVGPDGSQDVRVSLAKLSPNVEIQAVAIDAASGGPSWRFGTNPEGKANAELVRDPKQPALAELYFQPDRDLRGVELKLEIRYANGKTDTASVTASACDPKLRMPAPPPLKLVPNTITARWLGQDNVSGGKPGDVHVTLEGITRSHIIAAVALSGAARGSWYEKGNDRVVFAPEPEARPLVFRRRADATKADLFFPPDRDETGGTMTLRLVLGDGGMTIARFPGGKADVGRRSGPGPIAATASARPGDNLQALVERHGTVKLTAGTYRLDRPLVITRPVVISAAAPGVTLLFSQKPGDPPWSSAIKIHAGHVGLDGFAVRFAGPIRWRENIRYGPAVIGLPDDKDPPPALPIADLSFTRLDLQSPPATKPEGWEWSINLMRLYGALSGRIENCTLKGGLIEFFGGPWRIVGNTHDGTQLGTKCAAVFAGHDLHDLLVKDNRTKFVAPAGKTWRFLVLTGAVYNHVVETNAISGIGPRDDDTIPSENAPETILTEAYGLHFEGAPAAISADGRILRIPEPQGEPARTGAIVAVLAGSKAGAGHRVAQAIDARTYVVDPPLPTDASAVSIATGLVGGLFQSNMIDNRGGSKAESLVLVGNQSGTRVVGNRLLGGGAAFRVAASASERPVHWGWSHNPAVGLTIEQNTVEGAIRSGLITVEQSSYVKSSRGRVYLSGSFRRNTASGPFVLGDAKALDPGMLRIDAAENSGLKVEAATVNGRALREQSIPAAAASLPTASPR